MELKKELSKSGIQFLILIITLAAYIITNSVLRDSRELGFIPSLLALLIVLEIIFFVGLEVKQGVEKKGLKSEIKDTVIALAVAIIIIYAASFLLKSSTPISAVVSCSMLPNLQRGDFVIVQGTESKAYEIEMTNSELLSLDDSAVIYFQEKEKQINGSIYPYCLTQRDEICEIFKRTPERIIEKKGAFTYKYEQCSLDFSDGKKFSEPCLKSVIFRGKEYLTNFSHDVIVYQPQTGDLYSLVGDIVHRALFKINVEGKKYYITRGDNNPVLDIQIYDYRTGTTNHAASQDRLRGKVIFRIPFLGYYKLFLSGFVKEDGQCRTQLQYIHIN